MRIFCSYSPYPLLGPSKSPTIISLPIEGGIPSDRFQEESVNRNPKESKDALDSEFIKNVRDQKLYFDILMGTNYTESEDVDTEKGGLEIGNKEG